MCPYFPIFDQTCFTDAPPINQNKTVWKDNFHIIHLVKTVCELTFSIIQMHYKTGKLWHSYASNYDTLTPLFWLHLRKYLSIKDRRTLFPKAMHHVCCFRWCILSSTAVGWTELVSLVSCILPPLCRFCAATCHWQLQIQTCHIWRGTSVKLWMRSRCSFLYKLFGLVRTCHIDQTQKWVEIDQTQKWLEIDQTQKWLEIDQIQKWLEICKCQWTTNPNDLPVCM